MRLRCTPSNARAKRVSATKSRSATASRLLSKTAPNSRYVAVAAGSSGNDEPASAPAPSAETSVRTRASRSRSDITLEGPAVSEEVVGQRDRLGLLEVRVARQIGVARRLGLGEQRALETDDQIDHLVDRAARPEPEIGRDLVVAAPAGVHLRPGRIEFGDPPFDRGVDVLVALHEREGAVGDLALDRVEGREHGVPLAIGQESDVGEHPHVGPRAGGCPRGTSAGRRAASR